MPGVCGAAHPRGPMKKRKTVTRALAHNFADVMEHGPRLSYNRRTAVGATCQATGRMLLTGLGGMGVGTMWVELDRHRAGKAPDFATEGEACDWFYREYFGIGGPTPEETP